MLYETDKRVCRCVKIRGIFCYAARLCVLLHYTLKFETFLCEVYCIMQASKLFQIAH
jgi:hypothetical protein